MSDETGKMIRFIDSIQPARARSRKSRGMER